MDASIVEGMKGRLVFPLVLVVACGGGQTSPEAHDAGGPPAPPVPLASTDGGSDASTTIPPVDAGVDAALPPSDAGADAAPPKPKSTVPSCSGGGPGTSSCGPSPALADDCCTSLPVPGGSYLRAQDAKYPATVSAFKLDKYEITVGRVRAYFEAMLGNPRLHAPAPNAGAHPKIPNSGWRSSFNGRLPGSWIEIDDRLGAAGCTIGGDNTDGGAATWTHSPGPYEDLPITCLDWYTLFAFCIWDGGRLPTDAEWGFAAEGGSDQRWYAWGASNGVYISWPEPHAALNLLDPVDGTFKYTVGTPYRTTDPATGKINDGPSHMTVPGRMPGYGKYGHADLTGNMLEYLLDRTPIPEGECVDCARIDWPDPPVEQYGWYPPQWMTVPDVYDPSNFPDGTRALRGGSWDFHAPQAWYRYEYRIQRTYNAAGARCARD